MARMSDSDRIVSQAQTVASINERLCRLEEGFLELRTEIKALSASVSRTAVRTESHGVSPYDASKGGLPRLGRQRR